MSPSFQRQVIQVLTGEATTAGFLVAFLALSVDLSPGSAPFWILAYLAPGPLIVEALRPRPIAAIAAEAGMDPERLYRVYAWMIFSESLQRNLGEAFHGATFRVEVDLAWWEKTAHLPNNVALLLRPELGFELLHGEPPKGFSSRRMATLYRSLMTLTAVLNALTWPLFLAAKWSRAQRAETQRDLARAMLLAYRLDLEDRGLIHPPNHHPPNT